MIVGDSDAIKQIKELELVINRQNLIINNVVTRFNFLLSMFSIDEVTMPPLCTSDNSSFDGAISVSPAVTNTSTKRLYSSVTSQIAQPKQTEQQFTKLRQSLVAAVYIDQRDRDNRASSFIISGLPTSTVHSDTSIIKELCLNEFQVDIDKRLGKAASIVVVVVIYSQGTSESRMRTTCAGRLFLDVIIFCALKL